MNGQGPVGSLGQRLWGWALGLLGVAIVLNLAWVLLAPLLPVLVVLGVVVLVARLVASRREW